MKHLQKLCLCTIIIVSLLSCNSQGNVFDLSTQTFGIPSGTITDQLVLAKYPMAKFVYYDSIIDAVIDVKMGNLSVAAYDEPLLRSLAANNPGLKVLDEKITRDDYAFAVNKDNTVLLEKIDSAISKLLTNGIYYDEMKKRWLPEQGRARRMPAFNLSPTNGVLRFATAPVIEPFSFMDESGRIVGFDIELACMIALQLGMGLDIVQYEFGSLIHALQNNEVDVIGACITVSEERSEHVAFSIPYFEGGIGVIIRENNKKK